VLEDLRSQLEITSNQLVYVGDGTSDIHVMLHVNRNEGLTIAVSEAKHVAQIARRTVLSDDALSVLVPILEEIAGWDAAQIRALFEAHGFAVQEWNKMRTDSVVIRETGAAEAVAAE
jgi:predicted HAD superfamily phosphohydrolase